MVVPAPVIELNEAHAALDEAAREQAVVGERELAGLGRVHLVDFFRLLGDIHQLRHRRLHAIGQLVLRDARRDFGVLRFGEMQAIKIADGVERLAADFRIDARWVGDEEDGVALRPELRALVDAGEEAVAPESGAAVGLDAAAGEDDEAGQIAIFGAEAVSGPRAHAGAALDL